MLLERFGEPISDSSAGQGVANKRKPSRGFDSKLQNENVCCQQCGSMPVEIDGGCCGNLT